MLTIIFLGIAIYLGVKYIVPEVKSKISESKKYSTPGETEKNSNFSRDVNTIINSVSKNDYQIDGLSDEETKWEDEYKIFGFRDVDEFEDKVKSAGKKFYNKYKPVVKREVTNEGNDIIPPDPNQVESYKKSINTDEFNVIRLTEEEEKVETLDFNNETEDIADIDLGSPTSWGD